MRPDTGTTIATASSSPPATPRALDAPLGIEPVADPGEHEAPAEDPGPEQAEGEARLGDRQHRQVAHQPVGDAGLRGDVADDRDRHHEQEQWQAPRPDDGLRDGRVDRPLDARPGSAGTVSHMPAAAIPTAMPVPVISHGHGTPSPTSTARSDGREERPAGVRDVQQVQRPAPRTREQVEEQRLDPDVGGGRPHAHDEPAQGEHEPRPGEPLDDEPRPPSAAPRRAGSPAPRTGG